MSQNTTPDLPTGSRSANQEQGVRVNGFKQILDMLQFADPAFRETLLKQIAAKDPALARNLRQSLR